MILIIMNFTFLWFPFFMSVSKGNINEFNDLCVVTLLVRKAKSVPKYFENNPYWIENQL